MRFLLTLFVNVISTLWWILKIYTCKGKDRYLFEALINQNKNSIKNMCSHYTAYF